MHWYTLPCKDRNQKLTSKNALPRAKKREPITAPSSCHRTRKRVRARRHNTLVYCIKFNRSVNITRLKKSFRTQYLSLVLVIVESGHLPKVYPVLKNSIGISALSIGLPALVSYESHDLKKSYKYFVLLPS